MRRQSNQLILNYSSFHSKSLLTTHSIVRQMRRYLFSMKATDVSKVYIKVKNSQKFWEKMSQKIEFN